MALPSREKPRPADDDLDPLPPVDGDLGESEEAPEELEDDETPRADGDPLDDATGEGDPVEALPEEGAESGWLDEAAEASDLDVGGHDFAAESDALLEGVDEPGVGEGDVDFDLDDTHVKIDDAGEEGPRTDDEELREEDLPRMEADAEGEEGDESPFWEAAPSEASLPQWDDRAWDRVTHEPAAGTVRALASFGGSLLLGGVGLARLDEGTPAEPRPWEHGVVRRIVTSGRAWFALAEALLVSRDEGAHWERVEGWHALVADPSSAVDVAFGDGRLWIVGRGGELLSSRDDGATWEGPHSKRVVALASGEGGRMTGLVRLDRGGVGRFVVTDGAVAVLDNEAIRLPEVRAFVALRGASYVLGGDGTLHRTHGDGWKRVEGLAGITAIAEGPDGSLLVATHAAREDRAWLARVDEEGVARIVAEIGGEGGDDEPRVLALAWDRAREIAWLAGAFGVMAFRPRGMRSSSGALGDKR